MYRNSTILEETGDYLVSSFHDESNNLYMKIYLNSNLILAKTLCPYIKLYIGYGVDADSINAKMCRISLKEPKYLGLEYEDLILNDKEKDMFIKFLSANNFRQWNNVLYQLSNGFRRETIYNECPSMPDYNNLVSIDINQIDNRKERLTNFYEQLKAQIDNLDIVIIHSDKNYTYTTDVEKNSKIRIYKTNEIIVDSTPCVLYDILSGERLYYNCPQDIDEFESRIPLTYMEKESMTYNGITFGYNDFTFSIYEMIVLILSARLNCSFDNLILKI